jgi:hypothetical protein
MDASAGLHPLQVTVQLGKELRNVAPQQPAPDNNLPALVHPVNLKNLLRNIQPNRRCLRADIPSLGASLTTPLARTGSIPLG